MKIYDCTTFYSEHMMLDIRFNILNKNVDKFIVVESLYSHSGIKKKLNFDINNYQKFKDKIIYLIIDKEPKDTINNQNNLITPEIKRFNSIKRIEQSYDYMSEGIKDAHDEDLIMISDNDEIPNLNSIKFKKSKKNFIIFKQLLFYYKFNLLYDVMPWFGSKACKKKNLKSFSNLKNLKNKKYPVWRLDTFFSNFKKINLDIVDDGGWHFTNIKSPEDLYEKMSNFGHHDEFESSNLTLQDLKNNINNKTVFYDHFADKSSKNKWDYNYKLKNINMDLLPKYLIDNNEKYKEWFDI
jgi:beta-1,4-mannosyl-glycoprotein beta-1,4-N-acetylglucosaminyltransferase